MLIQEWRSLGVQQSRGWVHYELHRPEPHILLFRRPKGTDPTTGLPPTNFVAPSDTFVYWYAQINLSHIHCISPCYFLLEQSVIILVDVESAIASKIMRIHARIFVVVQCKVLVSDLFLCTGDDSLGQIRVFLSQLQDHTFHFVQRMFLVITGQLFGSWHLLCWWSELRLFERCLLIAS